MHILNVWMWKHCPAVGI